MSQGMIDHSGMDSLEREIAEASMIQHDHVATDPTKDSGLQSLAIIAKHFDIAFDIKKTWYSHGKMDGLFSHIDIIRCAKQAGLKAKLISINWTKTDDLPVPFIATRIEGGERHVVQTYSSDFIEIINPLTQELTRLPKVEFIAQYSSELIAFSKKPAWMDGENRSGFSWFIPSILKHASRFKRILIASLLIQVFALASPKFFEVVIDKVLVSRGLQSLDVLAIGLLVIAFFEPLMTFIRGLIFSHLASGVNSELSARLFRHLIYLPLSYFRERQAGNIIARVRELDHIRNFLTGSALMMLVDLAFLGVFLAVMYSYSSKLFYIVLSTLVIFGLLWLCIGPFLRKRVEKQYERNADNTSFLTESVTGIETIKCLGLTKRFAKEWEDKLGASLKASFNASMLGHWAGGAIGVVQKISSALILWFGVTLVIDGDLSVGQLIAFNLYAGHVTMPILRLAQIWQDFQHTEISVRRIGDILNEQPESAINAGRSSLDDIKGHIEFRKVTFRYSDEGKEVIRRLDLEIKAGEVIGITGQSGSGKSTITKLIQRMYSPHSGQILIDNVDMAMADPSILRRNMGVVLQESFLFNGSIKDNIAIGNPSADMTAIEHAAELAGVDEFLKELPDGYETQVGERGGSLSGGQRQRIAIARALVTNPKILILDEATSALDYETEAAILRKLPEIVKGRTVIMIAHRLNCMPLCSRVAVMENGEVVEMGDHVMLKDIDGPYRKLWRAQALNI